LERFLGPYDALITPPTTGEAPATLTQTGNPLFCSIWSLCGVPAVTIPVGFGPRGLPLGLQFVGASGQDGRVLSAAHRCEAPFGFPPYFKVKPLICTDSLPDGTRKRAPFASV